MSSILDPEVFEVLFQKSEECGTGMDRETFRICLELLEEDADPTRLAEYIQRLGVEEPVSRDSDLQSANISARMENTAFNLGSPMKH